MTDHPNVSPIRDDDRGLIDGPVSLVPLHRAMPDGPRLAVLRDRSRTSRLRASRAIAIADAPFGERLVEFFQRWQFSIGIASLALATLIGCYFAFQMGRGL